MGTRKRLREKVKELYLPVWEKVREKVKELYLKKKGTYTRKELENKIDDKLLEIFGIKGPFKIYRKSPFYTLDEIAKILVDHKLVEDLEEGMRIAKILTTQNISIGWHFFLESEDLKTGEKRYRLKAVIPYY